MNVMVYVEGPSDKAALETLLRELIKQKRSEGIGIDFFPSPQGNKKLTLLTKVPLRAVDILSNNPDSVVVAFPDLYPKNVGFPHETYEELKAGIIENFRRALHAKHVDDDRVLDRFHVFCLKHDLEVLLLAAKEALLKRLGASKLKVEWKEPVEEQNHGNPPKQVIKRLFAEHENFYEETDDAPSILASVRYQDIAERCPECFKPFVEFLESLRLPA